MASIFQISNDQRGLRPVFEAKVGCGDVSCLQRIVRAVGIAFSKMGELAFFSGIAVIALFLVPISLGVAKTAILAMPAYLAMAGASLLITGELAWHVSERQVPRLTLLA